MTRYAAYLPTDFSLKTRNWLHVLLLLCCCALRVQAQNDFSVAASPGSQTVWQSKSTTYLVTITADSSFSGSISLAATGLPSGMTAAFTPASVQGSGTANLLISASPGLSTGSYSIGITGASGAEVQSTTVTVTVVPPPPIQYTYDALGRLSSVTDQFGNSALYTYDAVGNILSITRQNVDQLAIVAESPSHGLPGSTLTLLGTGFNSTAAANTVTVGGAAATVTAAGPTQLVVTVPAQAASGPVTITNTAGSVTSSFSFTVDTAPTPSAPDFALTFNPSTANVIAGSTVTYLINASAIAGFTDNISLSIPSVPSGATATFDNWTIGAPGVAMLTVSTPANMAPGSYSIQVAGADGALVHSVSIPLVVGSPSSDFSLSTDDNCSAAVTGGSVTCNVTVNAGSALQSPVVLSLSGLPSGVEASFSSNSLTSSGTVQLTLTIGATTPARSYKMLIVGQSGSVVHTLQQTIAISVAQPPTSGPLPQDWMSAYIGHGYTPGAGGYQQGVFTVQEGGIGIAASWWDQDFYDFDPPYFIGDNFQFVFTEIIGDGSIVGRVVNAEGWAGLMIRSSTDPMANYVAMISSGGNIYGFYANNCPGCSSATNLGFNISGQMPQWFKITRQQDTFTAYFSWDGTFWIRMGEPVTVPMGASVHAGLVGWPPEFSEPHYATFDNVTVTSATTGFALSSAPLVLPPGASGQVTLTQYATPGFSDTVTFAATGLPAGASVAFAPQSLAINGTVALTFTLTGDVTPGEYPITITGTSASYTGSGTVTLIVPGPSTDTPPSNWPTADIPGVYGSFGPSGSVTYDGGVFTVNSNGDTEFAYQAMMGDGSVIARLLSLQGTGQNADPDFGIEIRDSLSPTANVVYAQSNGTYASFEPTPCCRSYPLTLPQWLKITRSGNTFTFFVSSDGVSWLQIFSTTAQLGTNTYAGVYVGSINGTSTVTGFFDNLSVTSSTSGFWLTNTNPILIASPPGSATTTISDAAAGSFFGNVALSASGLPTGITSSFSPTSLAPFTASTLTFTVASGTPVGSYPVTITGTASGYTASTATTLFVPGSLPADWASIDIGSPSIAGTGGYDGQDFIVQGAGTGIIDPQSTPGDQFQYTYTGLIGDGSIIANVVSNGGGEAGIMIRDGIGATANYLYLFLNGSARTLYCNGCSTTQISTSSAGAWLKLARSGNTFTAYTSSDGQSWQQFASFTVPMASGVTAGLAFSSQNPSQLGAAVFNNVAVTSSQTGFALIPSVSLLVPDPSTGTAAASISELATPGFSDVVTLSVTGLPSGVTALFNPNSFTSSTTSALTLTSNGSVTPGNYPLTITGLAPSYTASTAIDFIVPGPLPANWTSSDVGAPGVAGSGQLGGQAFLVQGAGTGLSLFGTDQFQYTYTQMTGDGSITAHVDLNNANQAGIMIRNGLSPSDDYVYLYKTGKYAGLICRDCSYSWGVYLAGDNPNWLKLVRQGTTVTAYLSYDAVTWTQALTFTMPLNSSLLAGLAVASGDPNALAMAIFDGVVVNSPFSLSVSPGNLQLQDSQTAQVSVVAAALPAFTNSISLSVTGLPSGATAAFSPASLNGSGTSILTLSLSSNSPTGTFPLTISGTDPSTGITQSTSLVLQVTPTPYQYARAITISHAQVPNTDQTNFPVLVSLTNPLLKSVANGGHVATANGYDLIFTSDAGCSTRLNDQIETWNGANGQLLAWVQVPVLSHSADTVVYLCYGNPSITADQSNPAGVWDSNYKMVMHLPNGVTLSANDSTGNGNNGSISSPSATAGQIDGAAAFNGSSDKIATQTNGFPVGNAPRTVSAWFNASAFPNTYNDIFSYGTPATDSATVLAIYNNQLIFSGYGDDLSSATSISTGNWYYVVGTFDGSTANLYINGIPDSSAAKPAWNTVLDKSYVGEQVNDLSEYFNGIIDEVRVSSVVRSADWIATEYNNQSSPASFLSLGGETQPGAAATSTAAANASAAASNSDQAVTLTATVTSGAGTVNAGTVTFSILQGATVIGSPVNAAVSAGSASASYTIPGGTAWGLYTIQAVYSGATGFAASSDNSHLLSLSGGPSASGYIYQRAITLSHTQVPNTDQANFPVLVSLTDPLLKSVANGGHVVSANGYDLIFTSDAGCSTKLNDEIETWNAANGQLLAWVQVPTLSHSADTVVYLCYGNPSITTDQSNPAAVWDSNYKTVMHLPNGVTLSAADSTSNANSGTINGATATAGQIDGAAQFAAVNASYISIPYTAGLQFGTGDFTVQVWMKDTYTNSAGEQVMVGANRGGIAESWLLSTDNTHAEFATFGSGSTNGYVAGTSSVEDGSLHFVVGVRRGANLNLYVDGALQNSSPLSSSYDSDSGGSAIWVGNLQGLTGREYGGILDELRISNTARSADWIATEYNNQSSPSTFLNLGAENPPAMAATSTVAANASAAASSSDQTVTLTATVTSGAGTVNAGTVTFSILQGATVIASPVSAAVTGGSASAGYTIPGGTAWGLYTIQAVYGAAAGFAGSSDSSHLLSLTGGTAGGGYVYQRSIAVSHTQVPNTDQTNFPVLVSLTDPLLKSVTNGGHVVSANGYDLIFTSDAACSTKLNDEIETWNAANGQLLAWVQVPTLSHSADTVVYLCYSNPSITTDQSNPSGVWNSNYAGVWHFGNGTQLSLNDSTANANNGSNQGNSAVAGQIGGAMSANNTYALLPYTNTLKFGTGDFTISSWFQTSAGGTLAAANQCGISSSWIFSVGPQLSLATFGTGSGSLQSTSSVADNTWHYGVATRTGAQFNIYIDGVSQSTQGISASYSTDGSGPEIDLGRLPVGGCSTPFYFDGNLDELRMSNIARSGDWIATEYNNQSSPSTFLSLSGENQPGATVTSTAAANASAAASSSDQTVTLTATVTSGAGTVNAGTVTFSILQGSTVIGSPASAAVSGGSASASYTIPGGTARGLYTILAVYSGATGFASSSDHSHLLAMTSGSSGGGYVYQRSITISHTQVPNTDQTNFPVLVSLTDPLLKSVANGGHVISANGYDLIFTSDAGCSTKLNDEIETWNAASGQLLAWVQVPTLSHSADTVVYLCYSNPSITTDQSNPSGVWNSNYAGVWHFGNGTQLSLNDSTANANNGSNQGNGAVAGQIGGAMSANNTYALLPYSNTLKFGTGDFTISTWFQTSSGLTLAAANQCGITSGWTLGVAPELSFASYWHTQALLQSSTSVADNAWHYVAVTHSGVTVTLYLDGVSLQSRVFPRSYTVDASGPEIDLGRLPTGNCSTPYYLDGNLDELRMSNVGRSADWIATEYNNQSSPSTFLSLSGENAPGMAATSTAAANASAAASSSDQTVTLTAAVTSGAGTVNAGTLTFSILQGSTVIGSPVSAAVSAGSASASYTIPGGTAWGLYTIQAVYSGTTSFAPCSDNSHLLSLTGSTAGGGYVYQRAITVSHTQVPNTDQANFPVLVSLTDPLLKSVAHGGHVANTNGYDLIFTSDAACSTKLNDEIETWNAATGQLLAWVQVPTLSHSADTVVYLCYGNPSITTDQSNPSGVWDSNYAGVWHLGNGTKLSLNDSTANANNGMNQGNSAVAGQIGGAMSANNTYALIPYSSNLKFGTGDFTISTWFQTSSGGTLAAANQCGVSSSWIFSVGPQLSLATFGTGSGSLQSTSSVADNTWHYGVATRTGAEFNIYVDGVSQSTQGISASYSTDGSGPEIDLGRLPVGGCSTPYYLDGNLDELRMSDIARSGDWIATEYNNQSSPSTFLSLGVENPPGT